jgi:hypothetical protein
MDVNRTQAFQKDTGLVPNCTGPSNKAEGEGLNLMRREDEVTTGAVQIFPMIDRTG